MRRILDEVITVFKKNIEEVDALMSFDDHVLEFVSTKLAFLDEDSTRLAEQHEFRNRIRQTRKMLGDIKKDGSLKRYYNAINNQCLVLHVSYFASALHDLFSLWVVKHFDSLPNEEYPELKLEFTIRELMTIENCDAEIGRIILEKDRGISFQDMLSTKRAFEKYLGAKFNGRPQYENEIILAQACRHNIVHDGARVNARLRKQIEKALPRSIKEHLTLEQDGYIIKFEPQEIAAVKKSMFEFLENLNAVFGPEAEVKAGVPAPMK